MSLINRMLRDLSTRAPQSGDALSGVELRGPGRPRKRGALVWIFVAGIAGFTALFLLLPGRKLPAPGVRGEGSGAITASSAPAIAPAGAPSRFRFDATMSAPVGGPVSHHRARAAKGPPLELTAAAAITPASADASKADRPARTSATARDAKEGQARYAEGRRAMSAGDEKAAAQGFTDALALDPKLHQAREDLGSLRIRQGRLDEAERLVRSGLEEDPDWIGYRRLIARLELAKGRPEAALRALEKSQPSVAADPEFHGLLASAYQRLDRHPEAAREYQQLMQAQPDEGHWYAGYGISRDALGDAPGALAAYAQARALGNLEPRVLEHINQRTAALQSAS